MKKEEKEQSILNLFEKQKEWTSSGIIKELNIKDLYTILKELVYFEYLKKDDHNNYTRTDKLYYPNERKNEKMVKNYEIVLNKIFTGSFLVSNLK